MMIAFAARPGTTPPPSGLDLLGVFRDIGRLGKANAAVAFTEFTGGPISRS